jgi:hypothetical protein
MFLEYQYNAMCNRKYIRYDTIILDSLRIKYITPSVRYSPKEVNIIVGMNIQLTILHLTYLL